MPMTLSPPTYHLLYGGKQTGVPRPWGCTDCREPCYAWLWKTVPDVHCCSSPPGASPPPTTFSLPAVRSLSVRVVSGKGEFEFPAWKPHDAKPTSGRQCLTIRCARRPELIPEPCPLPFIAPGPVAEVQLCRGTAALCMPTQNVDQHESHARCRPREKELAQCTLRTQSGFRNGICSLVLPAVCVLPSADPALCVVSRQGCEPSVVLQKQRAGQGAQGRAAVGLFGGDAGAHRQPDHLRRPQLRLGARAAAVAVRRQLAARLLPQEQPRRQEGWGGGGAGGRRAGPGSPGHHQPLTAPPVDSS